MRDALVWTLKICGAPWAFLISVAGSLIGNEKMAGCLYHWITAEW